MRRQSVFVMLLVGIIHAAYGQQNITFGKVGNQIIDQNFVSSIQLLNPEFSFNPYKEVFKSTLYKSYILSKAKADQVKKTALYKDSLVVKQLALVRQHAEEKYLASLYDQTNSMEKILVSDLEAREYYNNNSALYTAPGIYSFFTAIVEDTIKTPVADVQKQLKLYASIIKDEFKSREKDAYVITYDKARTYTASEMQYKIFSTMTAKDFKVTGNGANSAVIYLLTEKTKETIMPFEKVKEDCKAKIISEKQYLRQKAFEDAAKANYPVSLDSQYFK